MNKILKLNGTGDCAKYLCEYIVNIDEQKHVVIEANI